LVGRYLSQIASQPPKELQLFKIQIEVGCYGINHRFFRRTKWLVIIIMAAFFVLFAFDMTLDGIYEFQSNYWLWGLLLFGLFPLPLWIFYHLYHNKWDLITLVWSLLEQFCIYFTNLCGCHRDENQDNDKKLIYSEAKENHTVHNHNHNDSNDSSPFGTNLGYYQEDKDYSP
jgi:hypothetical protein